MLNGQLLSLTPQTHWCQGVVNFAGLMIQGLRLTPGISISPRTSSRRLTAAHRSSLCAIFSFPVPVEAAVGKRAWAGAEETTVKKRIRGSDGFHELYQDNRTMTLTKKRHNLVLAAWNLAP